MKIVCWVSEYQTVYNLPDTSIHIVVKVLVVKSATIYWVVFYISQLCETIPTIAQYLPVIK